MKAAMTIRTMKNKMADDKFALFWKYITTLAENNLVNDPVRTTTAAAFTGTIWRRDRDASAEFDETPASRYRHIYFEAWQVDNVYNRLFWPAWLQHLHEQWRSTPENCKRWRCYIRIWHGYGIPWIYFILATLHLQTFGSNFRGDDSSHNMITVSEIVSYIQSLTPAQRYLVSEVITLVKLILVMPATNATSERSFSALRLVKI